MNSEFEWRNQMRKLGGPVDPARDLWPAIAARLDAPARQSSRAHRRYAAWIALAATLVVAAGAGLTLQRWQHSHGAAPTNIATTAAPSPAATEPPRTALDWAVPDDPTLAATAQRLDNASAQLQDALDQRPDAVFLVGLLNRTNAMRMRLMRKSPNQG